MSLFDFKKIQYNSNVQAAIQPISTVQPSKEQMIQEAVKQGIPKEIASQGPEATKKYAEANGINLQPPQQTQNNNQTNPMEEFLNKEQDPKTEFEQKLKMAGVPDDIIQQGQQAVQQYAQKNQIQLPQQPNGARLNLIS